MRIDSSQISFQSESLKNSNSSRTHSRTEASSSQALEPGNSDITALNTGTQVDISYAARMKAMHSTNSQSVSTVTRAGEVIEHQRATNLESIVSKVIGKTAHIEKPSISLSTTLLFGNQPSIAIQQYSSVEEAGAAQEPLPQSAALVVNGQQIAAQQITEEMRDLSGRIDLSGITSGVEFELVETRLDVHETHLYQENEQMRFSSQGTLTTEDGREINFMLELDMERSFELEESFEMHRTDRRIIDPLVINLQGGGAELTSTSFRFDLDADGFEEEISSVTGGTGFLALDSNNDGVINDGTELFGTQGQNGFADLARHDSDGNMWIDENDAVFNDLKVWTRDAEGNDQLTSLKDAGVGAIYLGSSASNFDLKDSENNLLGTVKRSGVFLSEDGQVASIQELDLAIHAEDIRSVMLREGHAIAVGPDTGDSVMNLAQQGTITQSQPSASGTRAAVSHEPLFINQRESALKLGERYDAQLSHDEHSAPPVSVERVIDLRPAQPSPSATNDNAITVEHVGTPDVRKTEVSMTEAVQAQRDTTTKTVLQSDTTQDSSDSDSPGDIKAVVRKFIFDEQKLDLFQDLRARTEHSNAQQTSSLAIMKETIAQMRKAMEAELSF